MSERNYKVSILGANEFGDDIAEVLFSDTCGFVLSQENGPGEFEISLHSFVPDQAKDFDYLRNVALARIPLDDFQEALDAAIRGLRRTAREQE